jgi:RimJ/RimL family protein N-acetyltransferase
MVSVHRTSVYMFKVFTHPEYRGKRLQGVVIGAAARYFASLDYNSIVCYVEGQNIASLRACHRLGFQRAAWACIRHDRMIYRSPACMEMQFNITPTGAVSAESEQLMAKAASGD